MAVSIVALSITVSANPGPPAEQWYDNPDEAMTTIFLYNLPTNLLWFSISLSAVCWWFRDTVGEISHRTTVFIGGVFAVALIVTSLGAVIDYTLLLAAYPFGYVLYYDLLNWVVAATLIFVSIYLSSMLFLNLNPRVNLIPAVAITAMNPIWWILGIGAGTLFVLWTVLISLLLAPFFLAHLGIWHAKNYAKKARVSEPTVS